jgi:hypothetical protein
MAPYRLPLSCTRPMREPRRPEPGRIGIGSEPDRLSHVADTSQGCGSGSMPLGSVPLSRLSDGGVVTRRLQFAVSFLGSPPDVERHSSVHCRRSRRVRGALPRLRGSSAPATSAVCCRLSWFRTARAARGGGAAKAGAPKQRPLRGSGHPQGSQSLVRVLHATRRRNANGKRTANKSRMPRSPFARLWLPGKRASLQSGTRAMNSLRYATPSESPGASACRDAPRRSGI